jgi:hypothetical protein
VLLAGFVFTICRSIDNGTLNAGSGVASDAPGTRPPILLTLTNIEPLVGLGAISAVMIRILRALTEHRWHGHFQCA